jgi:hypothetical protein
VIASATKSIYFSAASVLLTPGWAKPRLAAGFCASLNAALLIDDPWVLLGW